MSTLSDEPKQWTVLIVDDEPDNLGVAEKVLSYMGARVHTAQDGLEGMAILEQVTPTFILLDLSMPQLDGWQMIERLRADPLTVSVPVIALTAHAMHGDKERALAAGFDGYIAKPFRIMTFFKEIQDCLRQVLEARRAQSAKAAEEASQHAD
jgi:two-component system cell cycle response regulator DivK